MKAIPLMFDDRGYKHCEASQATHIRLCLPGPMPNRILPIRKHDSVRPSWEWNGSTESPTVRPSVLTTDGTHTCHSWITDGQVAFLGDCTHELAGHTVCLLDVE